MRVLHVDSGREYRGGQNQVRLLARELGGVPEVVQRVLTRRGSELARRLAAHGVAVWDVPWGPSLDPRALWQLRRALTRFAPHVVHAHDSHALQLAHWARRLVERGGGAPALVATRRVDFHVRPRSVWFRADRVIAISEAVKAVLVADGVAGGAIAVVPSGIDPEEVVRAAARPLDIRARLGVAPGTPLAVNVAALVDHKDQRTLIRAALAARTSRPDLHWAVAGEGELRRALAAEITRLSLEDRVHLLGYVPEADALIREADVFVMSSKEEGLGSVVLHALALGRPVVATRGGGLPEVVPPAALVPVGDAAALARKVVEALDRPAPVPLPLRLTATAMARGVLAVYHTLV
ncbi:MAG TPA: glycosyltransferase [Gemmatimonadales bacterium]|nr:glycosyltransferase [Gemmatimonadales bacterium]